LAVVTPPPPTCQMPLPLVPTLPTKRLKLTFSEPPRLAIAPPRPVATNEPLAARLLTKWVRWMVAVPRVLSTWPMCKAPPASLVHAARFPEKVELLMVS
jgi:hypothetical protein